MNSENTSEPPQALLPVVYPDKILAVDIGGSTVKFLTNGQSEPRSFKSGKNLTPLQMIAEIKENTKDWEFNGVSIGYPGLVGPTGPLAEPGNLGKGWVGFDFTAAFECPVKIMNDGAMQALGSYNAGKMLFLGLGTGLGSALIADYVIVPLELGNLWWDGKDKLSNFVGHNGLKTLGREKWCKIVETVIESLMHSFQVDYLVVGGGNAQKLDKLPPSARIGHNLTAFRGGVRIWNIEDVAPLESDGFAPLPIKKEWRLI